MTFLKRYNAGLCRSGMYLLLLLCVCMPLLFAHSACADPTSGMSATCDNKATSECTVCVSNPSFASPNGGEHMVTQMFNILNSILTQIQSTFYNNIIGSTVFQQALGVAFLLYIAAYGFMIMFNLASFRSNEVSKRLIKLAIVYMLTTNIQINGTSYGWTSFSTWIQNPIIGEMNQLISYMSAASTSGATGTCVQQTVVASGDVISDTGSGSGAVVTLSTGADANIVRADDLRVRF